VTCAVVYDDPDAMITWAAARLGIRFRSDARAIGWAKGAQLLAVTVYHTFGEGDCEMAVAADTGRAWLSRTYMRHVSAFPFITCDLRRITCWIAEDNARSLRFARHLGLTQEGCKRDGAANGVDLLLFGLLRRECRWLPRSIVPMPRQDRLLAV
jgi:hypothetical protein